MEDMIKNKQLLWMAALIVGWGFDFFYWEKSLGISFSIHVALALTALLFVARKEDLHPAKTSLWILIPLVLFSVLTFIRQEPFTRFLNHAMTLALGAVFLITFRNGRYPQYHMVDYIEGGLKLLFNTFILPFQHLIIKEEEDPEHKAADPQQTLTWKDILPYLRGVLLAIPVLALFLALFSAADPIFANRVESVMEFLHLEDLPEYIGRMVLIAIWTFLVAGLMLYGLLKSKEESFLGDEATWPPRFLGFKEAAVVMGSVNLLFFSFVVIQFRYFFGGSKNISVQGYTYAEYARRGFGELLAVAFFSLLLFLVLSAITHRPTRRHNRIFTASTVSLTLFVGIILASSLFRLRLYEMAYGFTRLRTYSHICILWIGALFAALLVLELFHRWRYFTLAGILAVLGFVFTLNVLNVDGFITRMNFKRAAQEEELDTDYLATLSNDAVPHLIRFADSPWATLDQQAEIKSSLACREALLRDRPTSWHGFLWSRYRAKQVLKDHREMWEAYRPFQKDGYWHVHVEGQIERCRP